MGALCTAMEHDLQVTSRLTGWEPTDEAEPLILNRFSLLILFPTAHPEDTGCMGSHCTKNPRSTHAGATLGMGTCFLGRGKGWVDLAFCPDLHGGFSPLPCPWAATSPSQEPGLHLPFTTVPGSLPCSVRAWHGAAEPGAGGGGGGSAWLPEAVSLPS